MFDKLQEALINSPSISEDVRYSVPCEGSGWPRLKIISIPVLLESPLEWWPSATAHGTE